jgi:hypothetical protein
MGWCAPLVRTRPPPLCALVGGLPPKPSHLSSISFPASTVPRQPLPERGRSRRTQTPFAIACRHHHLDIARLLNGAGPPGAVKLR